MRPKLPDNITKIERDGKFLFFNPDMPAWLVTNANGAFLLSLCDGENSVDDILSALAEVESLEQVETAKLFFKEAIDSGVFNTPAEGECPIKSERQRLSSVQLSISSRCNLNCKYCYATDRVESEYPKMTAADYKRVVDDILGYAPGTEISISPTGDVYPCQLLHYPQFRMGNIHEQKVSELHQNASVSDFCSRLVVDNIKGCSSCFLKYVCGGACRARAFHESGDICQSGSFCEYERMAFIDGIFEIYSTNKL